ncbi:MAG TPA: HEAT repeat domain-containing protein [Planctomycetota bacterium]|nr:HEAT repeat domain-containing protein [Planctomycetota bacterium]
MATRRVRVSLLAALAMLGGLVVLAAFEAPELRFRYDVSTLRRSEWPAVEERVKNLVGRGEPGLRVLEAVAFDRELATLDTRTRVARQKSLDALWAIDAPKRPLSPERWARYLVEARGLERGLQRLRDDSPGGDAIRAAAIEVMLTDTNHDAAVQACCYLYEHGDPRALPALRRAAIESPYDDLRYYTLCIGFEKLRDPANVPVLRRALLVDPDEMNRVAAAGALATSYDDRRALPLIVGSMRSRPNDLEWTDGWRGICVHWLAEAGEKRAIAAIVEANETALAHRHAEAIGRTDAALKKLTGVDGKDWGSWHEWLESHRESLPEQLDPEKCSVAPLALGD